MNFHETVMGKRFFESQLPMLITALQGISEKLSRPVSVMETPKADPDFLRELYRRSDIYEPTEESRTLHHAAIEAQRGFLPLLPEEGRKAFEEYQSIASDRSEEFSLRAFQTGFQTAVQMMVCGITLPTRGERTND